MIGFIKGNLEYTQPGRVIVNVNGFGVIVNVSDYTLSELPLPGNDVKLFTHMTVREDDISLYGFLTDEELRMFDMLIGVSGVGPKGAVQILGTYSVSEIKYYIVTEDSAKIAKAPTVGKKIAERIILDLKDKVNKDDILTLEHNNNTQALTDGARDAIAALVSLGYDKKEAEAAVMKVEHLEELDAENILKLSLKYMF